MVLWLQGDQLDGSFQKLPLTAAVNWCQDQTRWHQPDHGLLWKTCSIRNKTEPQFATTVSCVHCCLLWQLWRVANMVKQKRHNVVDALRWERSSRSMAPPFRSLESRFHHGLISVSLPTHSKDLILRSKGKKCMQSWNVIGMWKCITQELSSHLIELYLSISIFCYVQQQQHQQYA